MPLFFSDDPSSCVPPSPSRSSKNMAAWKVRADAGRLLPVISFFLGAALTGAFVFLGATTDMSWRFAAWGNGARAVAGDEVSYLIIAASLMMHGFPLCSYACCRQHI